MPKRNPLRTNFTDPRSCSMCKEFLPVAEFSKYQGKYLNKHCKKCGGRMTKDYQKRSRYFLKKLYGISAEQYENLLKAQNYVCAICKIDKENNYRKYNLSVDHCHKTKKIRGLLCSYCNLMLGNSKDSISVLLTAAEYLTRSP